MISFNTKFWSLLLKTIFNYEDIFWCRFTDHSNYTNSIGLKHGGFVYGFIWSDTKPSNKQTVLDFPGKCVYIGQTTGEEYVDKKSATLSKLYSTCAKRMQSHFNALVNGNSDESKYKFFKEEYGYGKDVLNGQETLWLMMIPVAKKELYPNFNKMKILMDYDYYDNQERNYEEYISDVVDTYAKQDEKEVQDQLERWEEQGAIFKVSYEGSNWNDYIDDSCTSNIGITKTPQIIEHLGDLMINAFEKGYHLEESGGSGWITVDFKEGTILMEHTEYNKSSYEVELAELNF